MDEYVKRVGNKLIIRTFNENNGEYEKIKFNNIIPTVEIRLNDLLLIINVSGLLGISSNFIHYSIDINVYRKNIFFKKEILSANFPLSISLMKALEKGHGRIICDCFHLFPILDKLSETRVFTTPGCNLLKNNHIKLVEEIRVVNDFLEKYKSSIKNFCKQYRKFYNNREENYDLYKKKILILLARKHTPGSPFYKINKDVLKHILGKISCL